MEGQRSGGPGAIRACLSHATHATCGPPVPGRTNPPLWAVPNVRTECRFSAEIPLFSPAAASGIVRRLIVGISTPGYPLPFPHKESSHGQQCSLPDPRQGR